MTPDPFSPAERARVDAAVKRLVETAPLFTERQQQVIRRAFAAPVARRDAA